jgi:hypothetical protein
MGTLVPLQPPPQYDVVPPVPVIEQVLPQEEVQKLCLGLYPSIKLAAGEFIRGCAKFEIMQGTKVCFAWYIYDAQDLVRRHELAHCAGWTADHPGGRE